MERVRCRADVPALRLVVRLGVVACVAAACVVAVGKLDNAVAVFDYYADANAQATYNERNYPELEFLPRGDEVMEDGRLWMPEEARYRLVAGPAALEEEAVSLRTFLTVLLMPRMLTDDPSAPWAFCYGCSPSTLGPEYEVLSNSGHGFLFARRTS